jgi:hypothetical protein
MLKVSGGVSINPFSVDFSHPPFPFTVDTFLLYLVMPALLWLPLVCQ